MKNITIKLNVEYDDKRIIKLREEFNKLLEKKVINNNHCFKEGEVYILRNDVINEGKPVYIIIMSAIGCNSINCLVVYGYCDKEYIEDTLLNSIYCFSENEGLILIDNRLNTIFIDYYVTLNESFIDGLEFSNIINKYKFEKLVHKFYEED